MSRRLPISGIPPHADRPEAGAGEEGIWSRGRTFLEIVEAAGDVAARVDAAFRAVRLPAEMQRFFAEFPRRVRVLAFLASLDEASLRRLAQAERLFSLGTALWMRTFAVTEHPDLADRFPCRRGLLFVFFGDDHREFGRWEPPAATSPATASEPPSPAAEADDGQSLGRELARILAPYGGLPVP